MIRSMKEMIPQSVCLPLLTQTETCSLSIYGDLWQPAALLTFLFLCFCECIVATNQPLMAVNYCRVRSTIRIAWLILLNQIALLVLSKHF